MQVPKDALLATITRRLKLQPQWVHHTPEGTAFIVTETGCWVSLGDKGDLHVEIRVATEVLDAATAEAFCDARNHMALLGRWLYASDSGVIALVADLPIRTAPAFDIAAVATELVAELICAAGTVQFKSAPQRDLDGYKAVPTIRGKIRSTRNRTDEHLPRHTYPRGSDPAVAEEALILAQDILLIPLLEWSVEHESGSTVATHADGTQLLLQVAQHPHAGWGLVASLRPSWTADRAALNELNAAAGTGLTHWTANGDTVENRVFIPNAVIEASKTDAWSSAQLVVGIVEKLITQNVRTPAGGSGLQRPTWPGDDLTSASRRREPWNDGRVDDDPDWYGIYLDMFGRMATLTEPSYRAWFDRLTLEDLEDSTTARFIAFMEARMHDRDERARIANGVTGE